MTKKALPVLSPNSSSTKLALKDLVENNLLKLKLNENEPTEAEKDPNGT
jgi:hypothetical protein